MKVAVIGTGYVGLVSGVCLAAHGGHQVTCVDQRQEVVEQINRGEPPIHERGLVELLHDEVHKTGRLRATRGLGQALEDADLILVAVGTPSDDQGRMDSRYLEGAAREIGGWFAAAQRSIPVVIKSTVLPGTTDTLVAGWLQESSGFSRRQLMLGMNPEFLREGQAVEDFMNPDRIVMGAGDPFTAWRLRELYASWDCDKLHTNPRTAEMIKYANNALLALQISASNELANLAAAIGGVDIMEVMQGVYLDHRWNPVYQNETGKIRANPKILSYLKPGCGFGGSCFPKDVSALKTRGQDLGLPMRMLNAVLEVNRQQPGEVIRLLDRVLEKDWRQYKVGVLGMAFKPGTDDIRESASLIMVDELLQHGATVYGHDPIAMSSAQRVLTGKAINWTESWQELVRDCDVIIVATEWPEYSSLPEHLVNLSGKIIMDPRRFFHPANFSSHRYYSVGLNRG